MSDVNPFISEDSWFEILKCLPVKTLGICRCVCKSWHSLIISETFMSAHLKHYTLNDANSLLLHKDISKSKSSTHRDYEECRLYRDCSQLIQGNSLHTSVFPLVLSKAWCAGNRSVVSVHGLLCISDHDGIFVWNPLLQKCIKLPASTSTKDRPVLGFGFDGAKNDYRVVKISDREEEGESTTTSLLFEVYSVQARKWRIINSDYLIDNSIYKVSFSHCFLNGAIHWLTHNPIYGSRSLSKHLLLFNVSEETFDKMQLPDDIVQQRPLEFSIFEHQPKLAVACLEHLCCDIEISFRCEIWVKQDYNTDSSWCRILRVGYWDDYHHYMGPIQYLGKNDELIGFAKESDGHMMCYDPKTGEIKEIGLLISGSTRFIAFSESLVLLDQNIGPVVDEKLQRCKNLTNRLQQIILYGYYGDSEEED